MAQVRGARVVLGNTTRSSLVEERLQRSWGCAGPQAACTPGECHCYGGLTHSQYFVYISVGDKHGRWRPLNTAGGTGLQVEAVSL